MKTLGGLLVLLAVAALVIPFPPAVRADPSLTVTPAHGPVGTSVTVSGTGLPAGAVASLEWWTMEGNRVTGSGFAPVSWPLGTATVTPGGEMSFGFTVPSDLGGATPHNVTVLIGGVVVAETPFYLDRVMSITPERGPEGTIIEFELEGGGWTQFDNIVALTYDNAFIGYACSFTNQGHISVWIQAVGAKGMHQIGVYPALYNGPRSWDPKSNPEPFKHAALNPDDMLTIYDPEFFTFEITESSQAGVSRLDGATDLREVLGAGDTLVIAQVPAEADDGGSPDLGVGNGGKGIVGGVIPYALAGFPPNAHVVLRWDTRDGVMKAGGVYEDTNLGWIFTETYAVLGEVDVDGTGVASGTLPIPEDFGGEKRLEALVDGVVLAEESFLLIGRFTATLSEDGTQVLLHGTGLGWEKYTAGYNVLYDGKEMGWITGMTTRGTAHASVPVVGESGMHTIEVFGGQSGYPFLNKHETSWPWERVYRFAFMIEEPPAPPVTPPASTASLPVWVAPPLIVVALAAGFAAARLRRRKPEVSEPSE